MPSCSNCEARGILSCEYSARDSSKCAECVRQGSSLCDICGVSDAQLDHIASKRWALDRLVEEAEEALLHVEELEQQLILAASLRVRAARAKVLRLRKQHRLWALRMRRAVTRGIANLAEVEVEGGEDQEEAAAVGKVPVGPSVVVGSTSEAPPSSFSAMTDPGSSGETPAPTAGNSPNS